MRGLLTKATITNQQFSPQSKGNRRFWFPSYDKTAIYNWIDHSMLVSKHSGWKSPKNVSFDEIQSFYEFNNFDPR